VTSPFRSAPKASDFHPRLAGHDEADDAWRLLHQSLADQSGVLAFKVSEPCSDGPSEEHIAPKALASLDWADLTGDGSDYRAVVVSSSAMVIAFPPGKPVAFTFELQRGLNCRSRCHFA
jgi:hypothetical protein